MHFKTGRIAGIIAASMLMGSSLIAILLLAAAGVPEFPVFSLEEYPVAGRLDLNYLARLWEWRHDVFPMQLAIEFFLAVGLLLTIHPITCLAKLYSPSTAPPFLLSVMSNAFIIGVLLNSFEFLEDLGTVSTGLFLSSSLVSTMQGTDRQALEISYNLLESLSVWIFSLDYVFLAVGFGVSSYLSFKYGYINSWHGVLGAFCAVLSLAGFALSVAETLNSTVFMALSVVSLVLFGVAFPFWLAFLAYILGSDDWKITTERSTTAQVVVQENAESVDLDAPETL